MSCVCCQEECLATGLNLYTNPEASLVQVHIQHINLLGRLSLNGKSPPLPLLLRWINHHSSEAPEVLLATLNNSPGCHSKDLSPA